MYPFYSNGYDTNHPSTFSQFLPYFPLHFLSNQTRKPYNMNFVFTLIVIKIDIHIYIYIYGIGEVAVKKVH